MFNTMVDFVDLFLAALMVGSMFCVWLVFNPSGLDAAVYITLQQHAIRTLNRSMPVLGAATAAVTILATALHRNDPARMTLLISGLVCLIAAGLVTRFLNQPINAVVVTWHAALPPANWMGLRDQWWLWHRIRLAAGIAGLSFLIAAVLTPDRVP